MRVGAGPFVEESFLKEEDGDNAYRDGGIRQVKDGTKEFEIVAPDKGEPAWVMRLYDREVEHVDHAPVKEGGISMLGKHLRHVVVGAMLEDEPIEHTIEEIAERSREDEAGAYDKPAVVFLFYDRLDIVDAEHHGYQAKQGQRHLSPAATKFPAPGHPLVLYKIDLRLVSQQLDPVVIRGHRIPVEIGRMAQRHMCFYPNLKGLIGDDDQ